MVFFIKRQDEGFHCVFTQNSPLNEALFGHIELNAFIDKIGIIHFICFVLMVSANVLEAHTLNA